MSLSTKPSKSETTRALILETALRLFRERGFEETTMRAIAEEAGVSLGNAYYYFRSKDQMIHAFYARLQFEQLKACEGILATQKSFQSRLSGIIRAQLAISTPYHKLFTALFKIAADPANSLNPFSPETESIRNPCIARFQEVIDGSREKIPDDLKCVLPQLLWLFHLGIVLFWIYDRSPGFLRTYRLLELSSELISRLLSMASLPVLSPMRKSILKLVDDIRVI